MAVTIVDLRARVETDLDDPTVQRILDAAVKAVDRAAGSISDDTETKIARNSAWLTLNRRHTAITSITERLRHTSDPVVLATDDWREVGDYRILRVTDGTNPAVTWGAEVVILFTPEVDTEIRDRVALDLSAVDIEFRPFDEEKTGNWTGKSDWKKQRKQLLNQVREGRSPFA